MTTSSNECAKLFDGALRQLVSWSDCDALGGFHKTLADLKASDPDASKLTPSKSNKNYNKKRENLQYFQEPFALVWKDLGRAHAQEAFRLGLEGLGTSSCTRVNPLLKANLEQLQKDAKEYGNERERKHAKAAQLYAQG
ncbi:unnamed protein product [Cylicostephanus goldi]|uniref:Uncharacterized protein n=1 Tax=Cylicostephanus goldi TaxID=71465 RepID=A0A3P7N8S8_CYLGO|nr:unnamed protein product [Cylicostephanus goldi]